MFVFKAIIEQERTLVHPLPTLHIADWDKILRLLQRISFHVSYVLYPNMFYAYGYTMCLDMSVVNTAIVPCWSTNVWVF
jgi:hypothetical protein